MLDTDTKRKIENCRDILVGKIPDPKSQVEQITIALIYKFMDDMDQDSIYRGGKPSFFTGDFEKYSWSNIFSPRLSGFEILNLYGEALVKMNQNPNIPQLFRDIFKNVTLPYRDPETLRLFLKEIRGFTYDHSERLGDAFEYLLSVLGSQGKAGQFRTPRHIIDFIVKVVDPQLNQTVLDPACGTAGFLISAYKHIYQNYPNLSISQKHRLMKNFTGYDISYDMVRLSLVNMYLHGFPNPQPQIHEYDTLTYEEKWKDTFDIIMANPPFMTPKGGIRPHSRFSVQAKRSEVLFVDYIAEHLNPSGRAGVIVPEGIIFQSQNAYKALRKMLIENYLWAVVSLPAGVFNPYSGVKTSILFMDKSLSKRIDKILFVKIENDGFDLGAQRRPIDNNDLPLALKCLNIYKSKIVNKKSKIENNEIAHAVPKSQIAKSGDYNLSGDRYREFEHHKTTEWPMISLGDVCEIDPPKKHLSQLSRDLEVSFVPMADLNAKQKYFVPIQIRSLKDVVKGYTYFKDNDVLLAKITPCFENGKAAITRGLKNGIGFGSTEFIVLRPSDRILPDLLYHFISQPAFVENGINHMTGSAGQQRISVDFVKCFKIPLPPLEVQEKIVSEIDGYQKIIDAARQIVENYKPTIKINPDWPMVSIDSICDLMTGGTPKSTVKEYYENGDIKWLVSGDIHLGEIYDCPHRITKAGLENSNARFLPVNSVLIALNGQGKTRGTVAMLRTKATCNQSIVSINPKDINSLIPEFLFIVLKGMYQEIRNITGDNQRSGLCMRIIKDIKIPMAPLPKQKQIVAEIEAEQKIVNDNKKLIEIFEQKIKDTISQI